MKRIHLCHPPPCIPIRLSFHSLSLSRAPLSLFLPISPSSLPFSAPPSTTIPQFTSHHTLSRASTCFLSSTRNWQGYTIYNTWSHPLTPVRGLFQENRQASSARTLISLSSSLVFPGHLFVAIIINLYESYMILKHLYCFKAILMLSSPSPSLSLSLSLSLSSFRRDRNGKRQDESLHAHISLPMKRC